MADLKIVPVEPGQSGRQSEFLRLHRDMGDFYAEVTSAVLEDGAGNAVGVTANALDVNIASGAAAGGTSMTDDTAFAVGTSSYTPVGGTYKSVLDAVDDNDGGIFAMTAKRAQHVYLVDVDGAPLAVGGGTQYTEDAAAAANPVGTAPILVRADTPATVTDANGDNVAQRATNYGAAYVQIVSSAGAFVDSFGGGTQYTEGNTDATITGTAQMWEDAADTLVAVSAAKPLPVDIKNASIPVTDNGGSLTVDGTVAATQSGVWNVTNVSGTVSLPTGASTLAEQQTQTTHLSNAATSLSVLDDWDETDRAKVNIIVGQAGIAAGAGAVGVTVPRVTLASDDPAVVALQILDNAIAGSEMQVDIITVPAPLNLVGGGTEAAALRVTLASDSTGVLSVDDNGGALTVDNAGTFAVQATLQAGTAYAGKVRLTDGTTDTDIRDLANSNALNVAIVDATGDQITSFGGGTQYTEDAASAANPVGTAPILVRADTPATVADANGDNVAQRGTNYGAAYTQIVTSAGAFVDTFGGGAQYTEGDTDASITGTAMMMEVAADTLQPVQGTVADGLLVNLGTNNDVTVTGSVTANAGTNLNTSALALEAGGNLAAAATSLAIIDDWDETDRAKVNPIVGQAGIAAGAGAVGVTVPRVTLASDDPAVTALQIMDDWDETDRAKVNIIAGQAGITAGAGAVAANTPRVTHASDDPVTVALQLIDDTIIADDAAATVASTKVMMSGLQAVAHGSTPDVADALDAGWGLMNRHRIPFIIGGHPNIVSAEYNTTAATTDDNVVAVVSAGTIIVVTGITVTTSAACTVNVGVRIGFGATTLTAKGASQADGVTKIILSHAGIAPGSGIVKGHGGGIVGIGADGDDLRITCDAPTGGELRVQVDYFTISS